MRWNLIAIGKPSLPWAKQGCDDYSHRLKRVATLDIHYLKDGPPEFIADKVISTTENSRRILLDEKGKAMSSIQLADWIQNHHLSGTKCISLIIGGADGHPPGVRAVADETWSLSSFTLQHELALVVLMEQLYRAHSILRGSPYHRP